MKKESHSYRCLRRVLLESALKGRFEVTAHLVHWYDLGVAHRSLHSRLVTAALQNQNWNEVMTLRTEVLVGLLVSSRNYWLTHHTLRLCFVFTVSR